MEFLLYVAAFAAGVLLIIGACFDVVSAAREIHPPWVKLWIASAVHSGVSGALLLWFAVRG